MKNCRSGHLCPICPLKQLLALLALQVFGLLGPLPPEVPAQQPGERNVLYVLTGGHIGDYFGYALAPLGDLDGDGAADFAVGATQSFLDEQVTNYGYVTIFSGKTGSPLRTIWGPGDAFSFGRRVSPAGDYDGDGNSDLIIDTSANSFVVVSPLTGKELLKIPTPNLPGYANVILKALGDLDGDGKIDFFYGDCAYSSGPDRSQESLGRLAAVSGAGGGELWSLSGDWAEAHFGCGVYTVSDFDGDRVRDIITVDWTRAGELRRVHLVSGAAGKRLRIIRENLKFPSYYQPAVLGDLNGDGHEEIGIAYQFPEELSWARGRGQVDVVDGSSFETLYHFEGLDHGNLATGFGGDELGSEMSAAGDVDGDAFADFLIGTNRTQGDGQGPARYGRLYLRSGRTGRLLSVYEGIKGFDWPFGGVLSPLGDVDGDGRAEFLVGSPDRPREGKKTAFGEVRAMRYDPGLPAFSRGDGNGDGRINIADAIAILNVLYRGAPPGDCPQALDVDGTQRINPGDAIYLILALFRGGSAPAPPYPECSRYGGHEIPRLPCERSLCEP